jgi:chromosome segregation ATPase
VSFAVLYRERRDGTLQRVVDYDEATEALVDQLRARVVELETHAQVMNEMRDSLRAETSAANARVAELEARNAELHAAGLATADIANKANGRAEAAEQQRLRTQLAADGVEKRRQDSESEAVQWKAKCEAAEREMHTAHIQTNEALRQRDRAEAEAVTLRAEVGRLREKLALTEARLREALACDWC